jgi:hypothetical protein
MYSDEDDGYDETLVCAVETDLVVVSYCMDQRVFVYPTHSLFCLVHDNRW